MASGNSGREIKDIVTVAIIIACTGYIFMGFSIAVQGVLQALGYALAPLFISLLRLAVFVFPAVWLFTLSENAVNIVWWAFPIAELLTAIISVPILIKAVRKADVLTA